ncbi:MAG TPA: response regulator [Polyangiaceae bacterium]|jgi:DNA-binding response OmpR family regulator|nr:response regulator [Polyangiaceae bacterium]
MSCVLVVDDDALIRRALSRFLALAGYEVVCASNGVDALELAKQRGFDAVLSDIQMPSMDGVELLRRLSAHVPDVPVVLTSGVYDESTRDRLLSCGAVEFLPKPVAAEEIVRVVNFAIRRSLDAKAAARLRHQDTA